MIAGVFVGIILHTLNPKVYAKGENEVGMSLSYSDRASEESGESVRTSEFSLSGLYLRSFKSFWAGGELVYLSSRSTNLNSGSLLFGVPFKYWMKGPESKGVGIYGFATPCFGKRDSADGSASILGLKMGPGLVVFLSDMLGIDTKLYYDYRRIGSNPEVTTGLTSGFSVYF